MHRNRTVARQPVRPVFIANAKRAINQQGTESCAVDKQITRNLAPIFQDKTGNIPVLGPAHFTYLAFAANNAMPFGDLSEEARIGSSVEMIGIVQAEVW